MSIPITGMILIPLGMILILMPWRFCLAGLAVFAMMSPAAVINAGRFGLEPGYFMALLIVARTFLSVMVNGYTFNGFVLAAMRPLLLFVAITLLVLFVALCFFQGHVMTLPGTAGFKSNAVRVFQFGRNNLTQLAYLLVNVCLVYSLAHQGALRGWERLVQDWDRALVCALLFAAGVCAWQFAALYAGVPFPGDFFYSNAGFNRADSQTMAGLFRINGPFEEPSTVGYVFTGFLLFAWARYRNNQTPASAALVAACIACLLVSTATTAFAGLGLFGVLALFDAASGRVRLLPRAPSALDLVSIGAGCLALAGATVLIMANWQGISLMLTNVLVNKSQSTSFQERAFADLLALNISVETYGIGVGLGSHKANSLFLTLLSNVGVAGLFMFCAFVFRLLRFSPPQRADLQGRARAVLAPLRWGLAGLLVIHVFSNPNLSSLVLWVQMGGLLALAASFRGATALRRNVRAIEWPGVVVPDLRPHQARV